MLYLICNEEAKSIALTRNVALVTEENSFNVTNADVVLEFLSTVLGATIPLDQSGEMTINLGTQTPKLRIYNILKYVRNFGKMPLGNTRPDITSELLTATRDALSFGYLSGFEDVVKTGALTQSVLPPADKDLIVRKTAWLSLQVLDLLVSLIDPSTRRTKGGTLIDTAEINYMIPEVMPLDSRPIEIYDMLKGSTAHDYYHPLHVPTTTLDRVDRLYVSNSGQICYYEINYNKEPIKFGIVPKTKDTLVKIDQDYFCIKADDQSLWTFKSVTGESVGSNCHLDLDEESIIDDDDFKSLITMDYDLVKVRDKSHLHSKDLMRYLSVVHGVLCTQVLILGVPASEGSPDTPLKVHKHEVIPEMMMYHRAKIINHVDTLIGRLNTYE